MNLPSHLFWDIERSKLDFDEHASFIIERVASRGDLKDWDEIVDFYGKTRALAIAKTIKNSDRKTINFLSLYFGIEKAEFECYTGAQFPKNF
ncbi:MAG: hypothetical protein Tsb0034_04210 [Ekhidna sp.]